MTKLNHRIEHSESLIAEAMSQTPCWMVSVSFGKDSCVLCHLLISHYPQIPVVFSDRGLWAELPETYPLIDLWRKRWKINYQPVFPAQNMFELYAEIGGIPSVSAAGYRDHSIITRVNLIDPMEAYMRKHAIAGNFMGRRAEENPKTRGRHLKFRGPLHYNRTLNHLTCDPLAEWRAVDVWAYIVSRDLPYHPAYDLADDRESARLSNWCGVVNVTKGRWAYLRRDYPELFEFFRTRYPEVARYV